MPHQLHPAVVIAPAVLLVVAVLPLPYGYFQFLRIVVTAAAAFVAFVEWERLGGWNTWVVGFVGLALLFNPVWPVHLNKGAWRLIDPASASVFVAYWWFTRRGKVS